MKKSIIAAFLAVIILLIWFTWPGEGFFEAERQVVVAPVVSLLSFFAATSGLEGPTVDSPMIGAAVSTLLIAVYSGVVAIRLIIVPGGREMPVSEKKRRIDSIYFLGFILTLCSLVIALGTSSAEDPSTTLTQNAVALSSTAFALVVRTVWLMLLPDETNPLEKTEVEDGFDELSAKVIGLANQIESSEQAIRRNQEVLDKHLKDTIGSATEFVEQSRTMLTDQTSNAIKTFNASLGRYTSTLDKRVEKINSIEIDGERLEAQLVEAGNRSLLALRTEVEAAAGSVGSMTRTAKAVEQKFSKAFDDLNPQQALVDASAQAFEPMIEASSTSNEALNAASKKLGRSVDAVLRSLDTMDEKLRERVRVLDETSGIAADRLSNVPQQNNTSLSDQEQIRQLTNAIKSLESAVRSSHKQEAARPTNSISQNTNLSPVKTSLAMQQPTESSPPASQTVLVQEPSDVEAEQDHSKATKRAHWLRRFWGNG